jgi:hypothetical protein
MKTLLNGFVLFLFVLGALQINNVINQKFLTPKVLGETTGFSSLCELISYGQLKYCIGSTQPNIYAPTTKISNVQSRISTDGRNGTIAWTTNTPGIGTVEYGTTPASLLLRIGESSPTTSHRVYLNSLKPNVNYYFRLNIGGNTFDNEGIPFSFNTKTSSF